MEINLDTILENLAIKELNLMQHRVVESPQDRDLLMLSPTGTGKTLAYIIAMLSHVEVNQHDPRVFVLSPSRELAMQSQRVFASLKTGAKSLCCYGGHSYEVEKRSIEAGVDVIFATPGRLLDHIKSENIEGRAFKAMVLDEFDKLIELGFESEITSIIEACPLLKRRILTSATDAQIPAFVGLKDPQKIDMLEHGAGEVTLRRIMTDGNDLEHIVWLLSQVEGRSAVIFCNFREDAEMVSRYLSEREIVSEYFHGGMQQNERESRICKFRNGSSNILVATDLAARGIDILSVDNIIHFHAPLTKQSLIHRNGRTARIGTKGSAYVIDSREGDIIKDIEQITIKPCPQNIPKPKYATLYIGRGKKDKINKVDIVGYLCSFDNVKKEDIGIIEVKDFYSYVAIKRELARPIIKLSRGKKIKKQQTKIELCR